jgi:hypothetical protein
MAGRRRSRLLRRDAHVLSSAITDFRAPRATTSPRIPAAPSGSERRPACTGLRTAPWQEIAEGAAVSVIAATPDAGRRRSGPFGWVFPSTTASLIRMQRTNGTWKTETVMDLGSPGPLTLDRAGCFFILGSREDGMNPAGRCRSVVSPANWLSSTIRSGDDCRGRGPMRVLRDRSGCVWMPSEGQDTYDCGDGVWRRAVRRRRACARTYAKRRTDHMVLVAHNILAFGRPGAFRIAKAGQWPARGAIRSDSSARDGTLWLGSSQGLYRLPRPSAWSTGRRAMAWMIRGAYSEAERTSMRV